MKENIDNEYEKKIGNTTYRVARKHVFFDVETGEVKFTYGGIAQYDVQDMLPKIKPQDHGIEDVSFLENVSKDFSADGKSFVAWEIGMLVKEIRKIHHHESDSDDDL